MRHRIAVVLAVLLACAAVPKGAAAASSITLDFAVPESATERAAWQGIVDAWNNQSDQIKVRLVEIPGGWGDYQQKMLVTTAAGVAPDIGRMSVTLMSSMIRANALEDLLPYARADRQFHPDVYFAAPLSQYLTKNHMYGMPISILTLAGYINAGLFANRGLPLPNRDWRTCWTWEEWADVLRKLTSGPAGTRNRTIGFSFDLNPERSAPFYWQNGTDILDRTGTQSLFGDSRTVEVLQFFHRLLYQDQVARTPAEGDWRDVWGTDRLGMFIEGPWMLPWLRQTRVQWDVVPLARGKAGAATANFVDAYVVFKGCKHPEAAWQVVRFFTERAAVAAQVKAGSTGIPVRQDLAKEFFDQLFQGSPTEQKRVWSDSVEFSRGLVYPPNWTDLLNRAIMPSLGDLENNRRSPAEVARTIDERLKTLLIPAKSETAR